MNHKEILLYSQVLIFKGNLYYQVLLYKGILYSQVLWHMMFRDNSEIFILFSGIHHVQ